MVVNSLVGYDLEDFEIIRGQSQDYPGIGCY